MPAAVVAAIVAAIASVGAATISVFGQRRTQRIAADLEKHKAEDDARRSYEYDARKRLYEVYEPLRVNLLESSDRAARQVLNILRSPSQSEMTQSSPQYRHAATAYFLLAPVVLARMIERRLTLVDLGLHAGIYREFVLAQAIYRSLSDDAVLATMDPALDYTPYVPNWRELRQSQPERYRRQGLPAGRLDTALDALLVSREGVDTVMSFGEFELQLEALPVDDVSSGCGAARDVFFEFDPRKRPVLWRILVAQMHLYWCFQETVFGAASTTNFATLESTFGASDTCREISGAMDNDSAMEPFHVTARVAANYVRDRIGPSTRLADRLRASNPSERR
jgi:hypothetical protein